MSTREGVVFHRDESFDFDFLFDVFRYVYVCAILILISSVKVKRGRGRLVFQNFIRTKKMGVENN